MKNFLYITTLVLAIKETSSKYRKADIGHGTTTPHILSRRHFGHRHHHDRYNKISGRKYDMKREPMSSYELRKLLKKELLPYSKTTIMDLEKSYSSSNERSKSTEKHWSADSKENYKKDCFICPKNMKTPKRNSIENDNDMETHERKQEERKHQKEERKHHKKSYLRMKEEGNSMETDLRPKVKKHGKLSLECRNKKQNYKSLCQGEVESNIESDGRQKTEEHGYVDYDEHQKIKKDRNEKSLLRKKEKESSKDSDGLTIEENSGKKSFSRQKKKESENIESNGRQKRKDKGKKKSFSRQKTEENISVEPDERKTKKNSNTKQKYSKINHSTIKIDLESEISKEANKIPFMSPSSPKPTVVDEKNDSDDANMKESIKDADNKTKKTSSSSNEDSQQLTVTRTKKTEPTSSKVKKSTTKKSTKETTMPKKLQKKSNDEKHPITREKVTKNKRFSVVDKLKNVDSSKAEDTQNYTAIEVDLSTDSEENQNVTVIKVVSSKKSEENHNSTEIIVDSSTDSEDNQSSKDTDDNQYFDSSKDSEGYQNFSVIEVVMATKTKETETLTTRLSRKFGRIKIKKAKKSTAKSNLEKAFSKVEKYMRKIVKVTKMDKADKAHKRKSRPYKLKSNLENQLYIIVTTEKVESMNNYRKLVPLLPSDVIYHKKNKISPEDYDDRMASPMPISSNQKRFITKNANNADSYPTTTVKAKAEMAPPMAISSNQKRFVTQNANNADSNPTTAVKAESPNQEPNATKDSLEKENEKFDLNKFIKTLSEKDVMENITNALFQNMLNKYKHGNKTHKINPNIARNLPQTEKIPAPISDEGTFEQFEIYLGNDINMEKGAELLRQKLLNAAKRAKTTKRGHVKKLLLVEKT